MTVLSTEHWVHLQDPAGQEVYVLSGTVVLDPVPIGPQDGSRWNRGQDGFSVPLRGLPEGQGLVITQWAPTVVVGSIQDDRVANDAGWAVDDFDLSGTGDSSAFVEATFTWAVGDTDGSMRRVAYSITVVGHLAPLPIIE